ncbi:type II toxin-antitoxin system HicB family antitoxin [Komarekiella sp. 'clone 1']|uniref:Type II toxin-antitoxin system HicB family antitoxin n=1 Tax=Komarekiella delphini-convector SJRDD-AB1 TaxID=2593771 RepID=A0AA40STH4_9NOST|nr:type II toxin-antitoxin system HicB family antitoxin [Komarekiella delphini-convector]MBD6614945.1 type II toxin-antitoxin system HicB family antitoxin [Komarekiella delphini-convector SJRDD-AB1]
MERLLNIHIEKLPEGVYLATSDELQGLVTQGRTVAETLEIAHDVARKLLEAQSQNNEPDYLQPIAEQFNYPLVVSQ